MPFPQKYKKISGKRFRSTTTGRFVAFGIVKKYRKQKIAYERKQERESMMAGTDSQIQKEMETDKDVSRAYSKATSRNITRQAAQRMLDASRGELRSSGSLGDQSICGIIPYEETIIRMENDIDFKIQVIQALKSMYMRIRDKLYRMIGTPSARGLDRTGIVPRDTGHLRRSLRWSLSERYAIVPNESTAPREVGLYLWLFAKATGDQNYEALSGMARIKAFRNGPPAVQHPTGFKSLDTSRKTGLKKFDPAAEPDFFNMLLSEGKRMARSLYNKTTIISDNFRISTASDIKV